MRDKFTELVNKGVASFHHEPIAQGTPELDPVVRLYNMYWGAATDSHMSITPEGRRIITGHLIQNPRKWTDLVLLDHWGGIEWWQSGYRTLGEFLQFNCLEPRVSTHENDKCIELVPAECHPAQFECPSCCVTSESAMPIRITGIGNADAIRDIFSNSHNAKELAESLNNSDKVVGKNWFVYENKVACPVNRKTYIIEMRVNNGNIIQDEEFRKLMDAEGLEAVQLVQYDKFFRLESEDKKWQAMFKGWKDNKIRETSFDSMTRQDWVDQIKWMLSVFN